MCYSILQYITVLQYILYIIVTVVYYSVHNILSEFLNKQFPNKWINHENLLLGILFA